MCIRDRSEGLVYQGIKNFNPDLKNFPEEEKNFFNYFIDLIKAQIGEMEKIKLNSTLLKKVEAFKRALREFEIEKPFLFEKKKKKKKKRR